MRREVKRESCEEEAKTRKMYVDKGDRNNTTEARGWGSEVARPR